MEKLNTFLFHCLTPLTDISVKMYSDTKNNLTDVLNDDVTLKYVMESFVEVLMWMLVKCQKEFIQPTKDNNENSLGKLSKIIFCNVNLKCENVLNENDKITTFIEDCR